MSGSEWVAAQKDMALNVDSAIKTGDASYCDIALDKEMKNIISLGPNSDVTLGAAFKQIKISKGRVFSELKNLPAGSQFEIVTPQAIAGVRGTAWESIVGPMAQFNVKDHAVYVLGIDPAGNPTKRLDVSQGFSLSVDPSGWLGELAELTKEDLDRMESWSNRIAQAVGQVSGKSNCGGLIEGYEGATANLFGQVLDCEAKSAEASFASANGETPGSIIPQNENQGFGNDVTTTTFAEIPEIPTPQETPTPTPTPEPKVCQGGRCSP